MSILPTNKKKDCYEIRLESIGGLGANLAGKMLAESGVLGLGLNGSHFSSYGSEKKGSPVKSNIRFSEPDKDLRDHSPIEQPDVIGIFHEALYTTVPVVSGLGPDGIVLVNSTRDFAEIRAALGLTSGTLAVVDALGIAVEENTKVNTSMLGALFRICSFLDLWSMQQIIRDTFAKKSQKLVESNLRTFNRGYEEVRFQTIEAPAGELPDLYRRSLPLLGYETQPIGGVIPTQGNSFTKDLSGSREGFIPAWNKEACIHCANCDTVCPDACFVWDAAEDKKGRRQMFLQGIDYQYCKGCLKCVSICPTDALVSRKEEAGYADSNRVAHYFL